MSPAEVTPIGSYRLVRIVGEGGMGVVWEAVHSTTTERIALKVVRAEVAQDPEFRERFQREARVAKAIDHEHVVRVFDSGEIDGQLFMSMELVEGESLRSLLDARKRLEPAEAVSILTDVARGLEAAHAAGLIHRDVKPSNIVIEESTGRALVTDFGVVKASDATSATRTGMMVGTIRYIAPEQLKSGPIDARADIYALGAVFYEMLTGNAPFDRDAAAATMWAHVNEPPPRASEALGVPSQLDPIVARAMAKAPADPYTTPGEFAAAAATAVDAAIGEGADSTEATRISPSGRAEATQATRVAHAGLDDADMTAATPVAAADTAMTEVADGTAKVAATRLQGQPEFKPPSGSPSAVSPARRRRRLKRAAIATVVLAAGLAVGGVTAVAVPALLTPATTVRTMTTTVAPPKADPSPAPLSDYSGDGYTAKVPDGWTKTDDRRTTTKGTRYRWTDPYDPQTFITIESTPNDSSSPLQHATAVKGSQAGSLSPVSLANGDGQVWSNIYFQGSRRVDYFTKACNTGVAVLGSSSPQNFQSWSQTFRAVADSIDTDSFFCW